MLKGHVFSKQIFGNPIFALFINTFLDGKNGISNNFKNGMAVTYSGSNLNVDTGAVCIQGRFLEEDSGSEISAGTENMYCKLVIEINLNLENTASDFVQGSYKIVKSASGYPNLTQNNIVKNVSGIYQYELARFKTGTTGIVDFSDRRTFLDFDSIYDAIEKEYKAVLQELKDELAGVEDGSAYILKKGGDVDGILSFQNIDKFSAIRKYRTLEGKKYCGNFGIGSENNIPGVAMELLDEEGNQLSRIIALADGTISNQKTGGKLLEESKILTNEDLDNIMQTGFYYAATSNSVKNKPSGVDWFGLVCFRGSGTGAWIQILVTDTMYFRVGDKSYSWREWRKVYDSVNNIVSITGRVTLAPNDLTDTYEQTTWHVNYPAGYTSSNCIVLSFSGKLNNSQSVGAYGVGPFSSTNAVLSTIPRLVALKESNINLQAYNPTTSEKVFEYKLVLMKV